MAIRNIVKEGDPVLNKTSRQIEKFDSRLSILIDDMIETLKKANGVGLAAPQVGVLKRVIIVDVDDEDGTMELVNPTIIEKSGEQQEGEGCLSCPGEYGITIRPMKVTVKAQDRNGNYVTYKGEGLKARAFCHEIDHLDGILFKQRAVRMFSPEELELDD